MGTIQNLIGQKYGKLTVVEEAPKKTNRTAWYCKCDCGNANLIHVTGNNLRMGKTKSCGCAKYANASENSRNRKTPKNNSSGCKGVCLSKSGKYRAYITVNHKWLSLGEYINFEEAKKARTEAEIKYFGEFRRDEKKN